MFRHPLRLIRTSSVFVRLVFWFVILPLNFVLRHGLVQFWLWMFLILTFFLFHQWLLFFHVISNFLRVLLIESLSDFFHCLIVISTTSGFSLECKLFLNFDQFYIVAIWFRLYNMFICQFVCLSDYLAVYFFSLVF